MTRTVQMVRGPTSTISQYPGLPGQLSVNTDNWNLNIHDGVTPGGYQTLMTNLNLNDLLDKAVSRSNLGAAPLDNPNFTTGAAVEGDTIATINALQSLAVKNFTSIGVGIAFGAGQQNVNINGVSTVTPSTSASGIVIFDGGINNIQWINRNGSSIHNVGAALPHIWTIGDVEVGRIGGPNKNLLWGTAANIANMDNAGGEIGAARGFYTTFDNGLTWGATTYINGRAGAQITATVDGANGVKLLPASNAWVALSDIRVKWDLKPIKNASKKVMSLRPVTYKLKTDKKRARRHVGLIAQDVQKVLPEAVYKDPETGLLRLSLEQVVPLLVAHMQEMQAEIDQLKKKR